MSKPKKPRAKKNAWKPKGRPRVLTVELARQIGETLLSDITHTIESASTACGVRAGTVREARRVFRENKDLTPEAEEIGALIDDAHAEHIRRLAKLGFQAAGNKSQNSPGVSWARWQLEIQAPDVYPRKTALELSGPGGGPIETADATKQLDEKINGLRERLAGHPQPGGEAGSGSGGVG